MSLFKTLKIGQHYMKIYPQKAILGSIFPEKRIIQTTEFAIRVMPFLAVFFIVWSQLFAKGDMVTLAISIISAIFALIIPLQGLYWLGKRSTTLLPQQSAVQFFRVLQLLAQKQVFLTKPEKPTYQDLANVLKQAEQHLDETFWQSL